tara:strand:+ start:562 stop:972 length:411 start_codon:yes stop_codon:yes gene_type:complete
MNENLMSEEEFQFFKNQLKSEVKDYLEIDDQIKALNKAIKERRDRKKKLSETILVNMKKFDIDFMNTKNGKLVYTETKRKEGLNKKNLILGLNNYFEDEARAKMVSKIVLDSRNEVKKVTLRRTINKKQDNSLNLS